jgi:hypothetical protein
MESFKPEKNSIETKPEIEKGLIETTPDVIKEAREETIKLLEDIKSVIEDPFATEPDRVEAIALTEEINNLEKTFEVITNDVKLATNEIIIQTEIIDPYYVTMIENFDSELKPIKKLHSGFNSVFMCEHSEYGNVVIKIPSSQEEIDFFKKVEDIPGIVPMLKSYSKNFNGEKKTALLTKYIDGADLRKIILGEGEFKLDEDGNILNKSEKITTKEEITLKIRETVRTLHQKLDYGCFDIRPINILIDKEGNPYLFDFDIQFGASRNKELRKWFVEILGYPIEVISEKLIAGPLFAIMELLSGEGLDGFKQWLTESPTTNVRTDFDKFRNNLKRYKQDDLDDVENLFNRKYTCKSLQDFLMNLPPDHFRFR